MRSARTCLIILLDESDAHLRDIRGAQWEGRPAAKYPTLYGSLSQLAEENGSNPFQFRFESEVNYHN